MIWNYFITKAHCGETEEYVYLRRTCFSKRAARHSMSRTQRPRNTVVV